MRSPAQLCVALLAVVTFAFTQQTYATHVQAGGSCTSSSDCYGGSACLGGTCCNFPVSYTQVSSWWAPGGDFGLANCTACTKNYTYSSYKLSYGQGACGACAPGYELGYGGICQKQCDPATEYRRYSSDTHCTKKLQAGNDCRYYGSGACLSGKCGGSYCCDAAAAAKNCSLCDSVNGTCSTKAQPPLPTVEAALAESCVK